MNIIKKDQELIWHPFTQQQTAEAPIPIKKAQGSYIYDMDNKPYLDLISSWWVNLHGHSHPEIAKAIYEQALTLEHVIFAGFTHEPAVQLCDSLKNYLPSELSKFFFSDNGSTSVEIALKMSYQYWANQNQPQRRLFLSFQGGYHGDTFGAMSVSASSGYHDSFQKFFFEVLSIPFPNTWEGDENIEEKEQNSLKILENHLQDNHQYIASIILEPLVQGASGMRMCRIEFLQQLLTMIRKYNILIIFDEVMTGFGRTGTLFALNQLNITPDFLCLSKGITGGFLPLGLTVATNEIYNRFLSSEWKYAFAHGHSYTANPLACAAALSSLKLLTKPETQLSIQNINRSHQEGVKSLINLNIKNPRILGTIAAFEVESHTTSNLNKALKAKFAEKGLLLRPLGNTVYLLPPYSITSQELEYAYQKISLVLSEL